MLFFWNRTGRFRGGWWEGPWGKTEGAAGLGARPRPGAEDTPRGLWQLLPRAPGPLEAQEELLRGHGSGDTCLCPYHMTCVRVDGGSTRLLQSLADVPGRYFHALVLHVRSQGSENRHNLPKMSLA